MACGDVLVKSVAFAVVVSPSHLFSDRVGFDIELDRCIWFVMTVSRIEEGISYLVEMKEAISALILWSVSTDVTNAMSLIHVMLVC